MKFKNKLLLFQIYVHIFFVIGILFVNPWLAILTLVLSQIVYVGGCGTVFFHRTVAHKNKIKSNWEYLLLSLSTLGGVSSAIAWAGTHRKHHRFSDMPNDPHSPDINGKWRAYWQLTDNDQDVIKYVPDLLRNPWFVFQHKHYFSILFVLHLVGLIFLPLTAYWCLLIVPAFLMWFMGSLINVFAHKDLGPSNNKFLTFLVAGEGNHRYHHEHPSDSYFGSKYDWGNKIYRIVAK